MKHFWGVVLSFLLLTLIATNLLRPMGVSAQTAAPNGTMVILQAGSPSACTWPSGASVTNGMAICATSSGLYYALNGSTTFNPVSASAIVPQNTPAVTSEFLTAYNSATGSFTASQPSFTGISGQVAGTQLPSSFTCTVSEQISSTSQTDTLSACH